MMNANTCGQKIHHFSKPYGRINGYPTNAPSPLKSLSDEHTKKFKCPVHSCRGLVL